MLENHFPSSCLGLFYYFLGNKLTFQILYFHPKGAGWDHGLAAIQNRSPKIQCCFVLRDTEMLPMSALTHNGKLFIFALP